MVVREDSQTLYGFATKEERSMFLLLISVSGVGANTARLILSAMDSATASEVIASGDVDAMKKVKGIGAKTAQRVIIELKDKVLKIYDIDEVAPSQSNTSKDEALSALEVLGFAKKQSERIVEKIISAQPDANVETIIKEALKNL